MAQSNAAVKTANSSTVTSSSSEDRRITRSKKALRAALIELMEEKGLDNITVNDLCTAADLNRGTFYNHFSDKEQLVESFEDEIMEGVAQMQSRMGDITIKDMVSFRVKKRPLPLLVELFDYLREQGDFLHAVLGPGGDVRFGPRLRDTVCTYLIQTILHERYRNDPDPFVRYYVAFYASAYLGVITRWIETGMEEDSNKMALICMRLLFIKPGEPIRL